MPKNLVIFCDGTGNQFGSQNSNVVKLFTATKSEPQSQVCNYDPGVGTFGLREALFEWEKVLTKILGLAFGWGITRNVEDAYTFLMKNYEQNDHIYIFGFSRGAFTARALAGMLHALGLMRPEHENLLEYASNLYQKIPEGKTDKRGYFELQHKFRNHFSRECNIHFLGLWDTVTSVGWLPSPVHYPYTSNNPSVGTVRHAVSIDERRCFYRQNLWAPIEGQNFKQVWFAGVHADVGGGYAESESDLAKISLEWMAREAESIGLRLDHSKLMRLLNDTEATGESAKRNFVADAHESLTGAWWLAELFSCLFKSVGKNFAFKWRFPFIQWNELGKQRQIDAHYSTLHESVIDRMRERKDYSPKNLSAGLAIEKWGKI
jgi:uncharacterized protein (DUF2235 family)